MEIDCYKEQTCKGLVFKHTRNNYVTDNPLTVTVKSKCILLKRKSCPGCDQCNWIKQDLMEANTDVMDYINAMPIAVKDNALFKLCLIQEAKDDYYYIFKAIRGAVK